MRPHLSICPFPSPEDEDDDYYSDHHFACNDKVLGKVCMYCNEPVEFDGTWWVAREYLIAEESLT